MFGLKIENEMRLNKLKLINYIYNIILISKIYEGQQFGVAKI